MRFFKIVIIFFFSLITYELLAKDNEKTNIKNSKIVKINKFNCDEEKTPGTCSFLKQRKEIFCDENEKHLCTGTFVCNPITWQNNVKDKNSFVFEYFDDKILLKKPLSLYSTEYKLIYPRINTDYHGMKKYVGEVFGDIIILEAAGVGFYTIKHIKTLRLTKIDFIQRKNLNLEIGSSDCNKLIK